MLGIISNIPYNIQMLNREANNEFSSTPLKNIYQILNNRMFYQVSKRGTAAIRLNAASYLFRNPNLTEETQQRAFLNELTTWYEQSECPPEIFLKKSTTVWISHEGVMEFYKHISNKLPIYTLENPNPTTAFAIAHNLELNEAKKIINRPFYTFKGNQRNLNLVTNCLSSATRTQPLSNEVAALIKLHILYTEEHHGTFPTYNQLAALYREIITKFSDTEITFTEPDYSAYKMAVEMD